MERDVKPNYPWVFGTARLEIVQFIPTWSGEENDKYFIEFNEDTSDWENDDLMLFVMPSMDKYGNADNLVSRLVIYCYKKAEINTPPTTCMLWTCAGKIQG